MSTEPQPFVQMRGISKHYGMVRAVHAVDLDVGHGEIVAVVGDNGAGKSTLIKILSGAVPPDTGEIRVDGAAPAVPRPERRPRARDRDDLPGPRPPSEPRRRQQSLPRP